MQHESVNTNINIVFNYNFPFGLLFIKCMQYTNTAFVKIKELGSELFYVVGLVAVVS